MSDSKQKRVMTLLSIVERGKGKKLMARLDTKDIKMHFQCVGYGTAPTEMMDIFGLGSRDKDIVISFAAEQTALELMNDFGSNFGSYSEFGGLLMALKPMAVNRLVGEVLNHGLAEENAKGATDMTSEHKHNLIMITVGRGYADEVMTTAKRAGATGGTVIRGRLAAAEMLREAAQAEIGEERDIICILAPAAASHRIMEDVNREFGLRSEAHGTMCCVPVEKAYKI